MKKTALISIGVVLLLVGAGVWFLKNQRPTEKRVAGDCEIDIKKIKMADALMAGLIEQGEELEVELGYYACNSPVAGDFVYYRYSQSREPVVKKVIAVEGDTFHLVQDENKGRWNLEVNGHIYEVNGEAYYFGGLTPPPLSLYEKPRDGKLQAGELIVFSNVPPGQEDSGRFGLTNIKDMIGKVKKN